VAARLGWLEGISTPVSVGAVETVTVELCQGVLLEGVVEPKGGRAGKRRIVSITGQNGRFIRSVTTGAHGEFRVWLPGSNFPVTAAVEWRTGTISKARIAAPGDGSQPTLLRERDAGR